MDTILHVEPTVAPLTWDQYRAEKPPYSAALDGFVSGAPKYDPTGPWVSFNHHEDVDRLSTRATCAQVLMGMRQGLFQPEYIDVNDCDEDVALSTFLLTHPSLVRNTINPILNRLVSMEDVLDCTAGAYPFPGDLPVLEELAWVFEPYRRFRSSGELDKKNSDSYKSVLEDVWRRIEAHLVGRGKKIKLDTKYTRIGGDHRFVVAREIGAHARMGIIGDGFNIYVSVRDLPDDSWAYVIGKTAFAPLNLEDAEHLLNEAEGRIGSNNRWGGGNLVIGSPRIGGSKQTPEEVAAIIKHILDPHS